MEKPVRVLFASSEVAPFATFSEMGNVIRHLPELVQESGEFESRIMMPRYGLISERKNRLHEVIRLSGDDIRTVSRKETLKVKVASIPGIRLQVYFMDNVHYFKRKGIYESKKQGEFKDNVDRALFFARSVIHTSEKLGWAPDVIHAHGWLAGLLPLLIRTELADHPLFGGTKVVYSTDGYSNQTPVPEELTAQLAESTSVSLKEPAVDQLGYAFSDVRVHGGGLPEPDADVVLLPEDQDALTEKAVSIYTQLVGEGSVAA